MTTTSTTTTTTSTSTTTSTTTSTNPLRTATRPSPDASRDPELGLPSHGTHDVRLVQTLVPHLQRAISIYRRLHDVELQRAAAGAALDHLSVGVFVLDREGRPLFYNRAAKTFIEQGDGLALGRSGLVASHSVESAALRRLIAGASRTGGGQGTEAGVVVRVSRPSLRRPYELLVAPLRLREFALAPTPPAAIVFVSDPEQAVQAPEEVLRQFYELTAAEARVARLLLAGARVEEVGERFGITRNTARTHVKRILGKASVRSQSELIRTLLSGPVALRHTARGEYPSPGPSARPLAESRQTTPGPSGVPDLGNQDPVPHLGDDADDGVR